MKDNTQAAEKEEPKPFLAIAVKSFKGVVRGAKVEGMKNPAFTKTRKVAHVGMFKEYSRVVRCYPKAFFREVENLAEFDGPTCEDACREFLGMLKRCTRANGERCKADGREAPVKLWKKLDSVQRVEVAP